MTVKNLFENKNHGINENFKAMIKFGAYIFLCGYLKMKKNCKYKYVKVESMK